MVAFNGGFTYDWSDLSLAGEYLRFHSRQTITFTPPGGGTPMVAESTLRDEYIYLSLTWHASHWIDLYTRGEGWWSDPANRRNGSHNYGLVGAADMHPLRNWSIKIEAQQCWGTNDVDANLNPNGISKTWQILALKTTVDF